MTNNTNKDTGPKTTLSSGLNLPKLLSSLKLTVVCLVILAVLVVWGTVYQAEHGLYQAQQKFFHSWVFFIFGLIPFPGTVAIMFLLFVNLVFSLFYRIRFRWANIGNVITHLGIIILLVGGFFTFYYAEESSLMLKEGDMSHMSSSNSQWELALWEEKGGEKDVFAVDTRGFSHGKDLTFPALGVKLNVTAYYTNCSVSGSQGQAVINSSGIGGLRELNNATEVADNTAGLMADITSIAGTKAAAPILLYGQEDRPSSVTIGGRTYNLQLRRKKIPLPLTLLLKDFKVKMYPNSMIPKSYESVVKIVAEDGVARDVVISMNKPLRFKNLTFFQSSYYIAPDGTEYSIFAVVKNIGRLLPYISSITIFLGMLIHFLSMMIRRRRMIVNPKLASVLLALVLFIGFGFPMTAATDNATGKEISLASMQKIVIMENGRKKPLDTFAENLLKQFSGTNRVAKLSAIEWLARVLFNPDVSAQDKVFLVTNLEVLDSMHVPQQGKARDRYSFAQLEPGLANLRQLAVKVNNIDPKNRSFIETEIYTLYNNIYMYQQLTSCLQFLFPHPDFTVINSDLLTALDLPKNTNGFCLLDIFQRKDKMLAIITASQQKAPEELSVMEKTVVELSNRVMNWTQFYKDLPLTIIPGMVPKEGEKEEKWHTPWDLLTPRGDGVIPKELFNLQEMVSAYRAGQQSQFDATVAAFNAQIQVLAAGHISERNVAMEVFYNKVDPFYKAKFFFGFSILMLLFSYIAWKKWFYRFSFLLLIIGFLLQLGGVIARMIIMSRPPATNLYETFVFTGLITALLGIILELAKKKNIGIFTGSLAGLVMLMIAGKYAMEGDTMGMLVAVLDSNFWLATHVITIILGYSGVLLSGFIGHLYILQRLFRPSNKEMLRNTFQAVYAIQAFGIIFTFLGTVLGGIWADQSWGRFWGWDPKENGALLILLWSAILFHALMTKWLNETGFSLGTIFGVVCVALAWFGVNLLGVGLHSYGFTSGVANSLFVFVVVELLFILITGFLLKFSRRDIVA